VAEGLADAKASLLVTAAGSGREPSAETVVVSAKGTTRGSECAASGLPEVAESTDKGAALRETSRWPGVP